jgi:hypothetical protein
MLQASLYLDQYFSKPGSQRKTPAASSPGLCVLAWGMDTLYEKNLNEWMV